MAQPVNSLQPSFFAPLLGGPLLDIIKLLAAVSMVVDHVNAMMFDGRYLGPYLVGRIAFPLFAFAAAASILRLRDDRSCWRQAGLLLLCAVLTEPVSRFARDIDVLNVLFTLGFGVLVAPYFLHAPLWVRAMAGALAVIGGFFGGWWEFGTAGLLLPAALAAALRYGGAGDIMIAAFLAAAMNFRGFFFYPVLYPDVGPLILSLTAVAATVFPLVLLCGLRDVAGGMAATSVRRLLPRYALHAFYPLHMLVLWLCK